MATGYTQFRTVEPTGRPTPRTGETRDIRSRQIAELVTLSKDAHKNVYGPNYDVDVKNFYNLFERTRRMPTFRPKISAPQLQLLLLAEAADLTDANIRVFIHKGDGRDKDREKAYLQHWRQNFFSLQLMMSQIYAQFSGTSFLQVGNDPFANSGRGNVWLRARHQYSVHCDPNSWWPPDWTWQVIEDEWQLDKIKQVFGRTADAIRPKGAKSPELAGPPASGQVEMPFGPMSEIRGIPTTTDQYTGTPLKVFTAYVLDTTLREPTPEEKLVFVGEGQPIPDYLPMYPMGRMIVDCEGTILSDGQPWLPLGDMWPCMPVWATPPWDNVWCPAPPKYTRSLQDAAEQQMTNTYENSRRLNQGFLVIHGSTGLTANSVGGLPGEVIVTDANSPPQAGVEVKYPPPMPAQMIELPMRYLQLQKEFRGATPARSGNLNPGNVGADLFEAAVSQSQSLPRLTARLFAYSVQKVAELLFYTMSKSFTNDMTFLDRDDKAIWKADTNADRYQIQLPEGAIRPMSATALRSMVIELRKAGMIDTQHALDMLDIPEADEIAKAIENEQKLAALAKLGRK